MSWSKGRYMEASTDLLFRVKISWPTNNPDEPIRASYRGPYESVAAARGMLTRLKRQYDSRENYTFELEACMPEWKVFD